MFGKTYRNSTWADIQPFLDITIWPQLVLFIEENFNNEPEHQDLSENREEKNEELFNQDTNEDDDEFEIPAFLRKQKF